MPPRCCNTRGREEKQEMTTSPTAQDTTAILRDLAAAFTATYPGDAARIACALELVEVGHVEPPTAGSLWLVRSACRDTLAYLATAHRCSCPDAKTRERRWKHRYAVLLTTALEDELRYQARVADQPIPCALTGKAYAALQLPQPWPAPSAGTRAPLPSAGHRRHAASELALARSAARAGLTTITPRPVCTSPDAGSTQGGLSNYVLVWLKQPRVGGVLSGLRPLVVPLPGQAALDDRHRHVAV